MYDLQDCIGKKINKLTILENLGIEGKRRYLLVKCDCGKVKRIRACSLLATKPIKSCGCYTGKIVDSNRSHQDGTKTKEYQCWHDIIQRCTNPNNKNYHRYGGRGIQLCEKWEDFDSFLTDMGLAPAGRYSIDRIDNNKGYSIENCRWTTPKVQANNTSHNRLIEFKGQTKTLAQWADTLGCKSHVLLHRLNSYGWDLEKTLTTDVSYKNKVAPNTKYITFKNETHTLAEWAKITKLRKKTLYNRLANGWPIDELLFKKTDTTFRRYKVR